MSAACLIATDLSRVRLIAEGVDDEWIAPPAEDPDQPPALRAIAGEAADWIVQRLPGKRLHTACLDVDEARCLWIAAPTREADVIAAAVRQRRAEWGEGDGAGEMVQPLVAGAASRGSARAPDEPSAAVLESPDAAVKLLFDALDARGVRVGEALSLWHALAGHAGEELTCVVAADRPGRLVWAWGESGGLVAAGLCRTPSEGDADGAASGRLALDWLTWSAQLGRTPQRFVTIGQTRHIGETIGERWPGAKVEHVRADDPLKELLAVSHRSGGGEGDPRRSTPTLTRRPSRSHRRVYQLASAAVLLVAAGIAGLGVRAQGAAGAYREARADLDSQSRELVRSVSPGSETTPDLVGALQSHFVQVQRDNPKLTPPPTPKPLFAELKRLLAAAAPIEGVTVNRIQVEDRAGSAQFRISAYVDGEELMESLDQTPVDSETRPLDWSERVTGSTPNLVLRLTGIWQE